MRTTTTEKRVDILQTVFACYGLPNELVYDNGPQFTSAAFAQFMQQNRINHSSSAPYHPATNGVADRGVQTFKRSLWTGENDSGSLGPSWLVFSLRYRNTPHSTTGRAPAELFLQRTLHTHLDILRPSVESRGATQQQQHKTAHNRRASDHSFALGQTVLVKNWRGEPCWVKGVIVRVVGAVQYEVDVGESTTQRCHSLYCRGRGNL